MTWWWLHCKKDGDCLLDRCKKCVSTIYIKRKNEDWRQAEKFAGFYVKKLHLKTTLVNKLEVRVRLSWWKMFDNFRTPSKCVGVWVQELPNPTHVVSPSRLYVQDRRYTLLLKRHLTFSDLSMIYFIDSKGCYLTKDSFWFSQLGQDGALAAQLADNQFADWSTRGHHAYSVGVLELTSPRNGWPRFGLSASWPASVPNQTFAAATGEARPSIAVHSRVLCVDRGTCSGAVDAECNRLRELMSATRCNSSHHKVPLMLRCRGYRQTILSHIISPIEIGQYYTANNNVKNTKSESV